MNYLVSHAKWLTGLVAVFLVFGLSGAVARAGDMKLEAQLVWGTDDQNPSDPNLKPADPKVEEKLKKLPFKWKNFFEVDRKQFSVSKDGSKKIELSKDCDVKVRNLDGKTVEVTLYGKGKAVSTIKQTLPKDELLILGGNAENLTGWFVVLRQVD